MSLKEITTAINNGKKVFCGNNYEVIKDSKNQYLIVCLSNDYTLGLTWLDGITLNGDESNFFIQ